MKIRKSVPSLPKVLDPFSREEPREPEDPFWDLYRDGVTQGWIGAFLDCPEKLRLGLSMGLTNQRWSGGALEFGSLFHEVLDRVYTRAKMETRRLLMSQSDGTPSTPQQVSEQLSYHSSKWLPSYLEEVLKELYERETQRMHDNPPADKSAYDRFEENYGLMRIVITHYFIRWAKDMCDYRWVSLETTFKYMYDVKGRLGIDKPPIPIRGKRDGDFRTPNMHLWLFETKTKGQINEEDILDGLGFNLQVHTYMEAMSQEYGEAPQGVLYNVIRRPGLRRSAKESLDAFLARVEADVRKRHDHYFMRYECVILPDERKRWMKELDQFMLKLVRWADGEGRYRQPSACKGRWGRCQFLSICGRDNYHGFKQREVCFPELESSVEVE